MARKNEFNAIPLGDTATLTNEEWLNWRKHGPAYANPLSPDYIPVTIGGSDCAVVFGDSPWKSRLELYHEKSGVKKPKYERPMNQAILDAGHILEPFVAKMFVAKMAEENVKDVELITDTVMYQHPKYPWMVGNFDFKIRVNKMLGILECKTTGNWDDIALWKQGIVPKKYEWQCRYYMAIADVDFVYICCCWGFSTNETAVILIKRDKSIEKTMIAELSKFVECCEMGIEPDDQTGHMDTLAKYYVRLYGEIDPKAPPVELPDREDIAELVDAARTLAERRERAQKTLDLLEEEEYTIASTLLKLTGGTSTYATYRIDDENVCSIRVKLPMKRASFDEELFKQENPAEYAKYTKESLDVAKLKKEQKTLAGKYVIPAVVNTEKPATIDKVEVRNIPA